MPAGDPGNAMVMNNESGSNRLPLVGGGIVAVLLLLAILWAIGAFIL
jgi:hypothetical protein